MSWQQQWLDFTDKFAMRAQVSLYAITISPPDTGSIPAKLVRTKMFEVLQALKLSYMMVQEFAPQTHRLHYHGLVEITPQNRVGSVINFLKKLCESIPTFVDIKQAKNPLGWLKYMRKDVYCKEQFAYNQFPCYAEPPAPINLELFTPSLERPLQLEPTPATDNPVAGPQAPPSAEHQDQGSVAQRPREGCPELLDNFE